MIWKTLTIIIGSIIFSGFTRTKIDPYTIRPLIAIIIPISLVVELLLAKGFKKFRFSHFIDSVYLGWSIVIFLLIMFHSTLTIELKTVFAIFVLLEYLIRNYWKKTTNKNN